MKRLTGSALALILVISAVAFFAGKEAESVSSAGQAEEETALYEETQIGLEGVLNARQLGGYAAADGRTVRENVLLRTAKLVYATEEDIRKLKEDYNLSVIVDFRTESETEYYPDPLIDGVKYRNFPILYADALKTADYEDRVMELLLQGGDVDTLTSMRLYIETGMFSNQMYIDILSSDNGKAGYSRFFRELLALPEGNALLFHCSAGKDRTGCAAMLILSALGADEETILEDFLLTNRHNAESIAEERAYLEAYGIQEDEIDLYMIILDQVNEEQMTSALSWMETAYGSAIGYITEELGVTDGEIELLRNKFLTVRRKDGTI